MLRHLSTTIFFERLLIVLFLFLEIITLIAIWFGPPWTTCLILLGIIIGIIFIVSKPYLGLFLCIFILFSTSGTLFLQKIFKPLLLLTIGAGFLQALRSGELKIVKASQNFLIIGFIVIAMFSAFFANDLERTAELANNYLKIFLVYFATIMIVESRLLIKPIIWIMLIAGSFAALIGFYLTFFGASDKLFGPHAIFLLTTRTESISHDPNYLALTTVPLIPLTIGLFKIDKALIHKIILLCIISIFIITTVLTFSRMGMLCLIILLLMVLFKERRHKKFILFTLISLLIIFIAIPDYIWENVRSFQFMTIDESIQQRLRILKGGFNMFLEHPIFGVGLGNFLTQSLHYTNTLLPRLAHNTFLEIAAEMGILGILVFTLIIIITLRDMGDLEKFYLYKDDSEFLELIKSARISFLIFLLGSMFLTAGPLITFWMFVTLTVVMKKLSYDI